MSRFMRIIIMYDLDTTLENSQKEYNRFHKHILSRGFIMLQYSIYMKAINAPSKKDYEVNALRKKLPTNGNIRVLCITNRQYCDIDYLRGGKSINESINTEERRIKINYEITESGV